MSCNTNSSDINQTFIIEPIIMATGPIVSACTAVYSNTIIGCDYSGNQITLNSNETLFSSPITTPMVKSYDLELGGRILKYDNQVGSSLVGKFLSGTTNGFVLADVTTIPGIDTYVTGGTYSTGTTIFTNNFGNTFAVTGYSSSEPIPLTGTTNRLSKFNSTSGLSDSQIFDDGNIVSIGTVGNNTIPFLKFTNSAGTIVNEFRSDLNSNLAIGKNALTAMTTFQNVAIGEDALRSNTGSTNTAIGFRALFNNVSGPSNCGIGYATLLSSISGTANTAVGYSSLRTITTGNRNTGVGYLAGRYIANGSTSLTGISNSVLIGYNVRPLTNDTTNENIIGYDAIGLGSNTVVLGNDSVTKTALKGNVLIGTTTDNLIDKLQVNGSLIATVIKKSGGTSTQFLMADGSISTLSGSSIVSGTGTTNTLPKFSSASGLTDSQIVDNVGTIDIDNGALYYDKSGYSTSYPRFTFGRNKRESLYFNVEDTSSFQIRRTGSSFGPQIRFGTALGTLSAQTNPNTNAILGQISFDAYNGLFSGANTPVEGFQIAANIRGILAESATTASTSAHIYFGTAPTGSTTVIDRMIIRNSGNILIGTTTDNLIDKLQVTGSINITADAKINGLTVGKGPGSISQNTVLGDRALSANTTGNGNTAIGFTALKSSVTAGANTAVGQGALEFTTASNNTAVGYAALGQDTTGAQNSAFGRLALTNLQTGTDNIAIGSNSGSFLLDGTTIYTASSQNIFIGSNVKSFAQNQTNQIVIGHSASGIGSNSVVLGNDSVSKTALKGSVLIGTTADTAGDKLQVIGNASFSGDIRLVYGTGSILKYDVTKDGPSLVGWSSGVLGTGSGGAKDVLIWKSSGNVLIGTPVDTAGYKLQVSGTTLLTDDATINGLTVGKSGGNVATNTIVGFTAGLFNTVGASNTFIGYRTGSGNTTGDRNTFIGRSAGEANTIGIQNVIIGYFAGSTNSGTSSNTIVGYQAGRTSTGNNNSFYGYQAGIGIIGDNNIMFGFDSGRYLNNGITFNTTTNESTFIGTNTKSLATGQTNEIVIGYNANGLGSNSVVLGNDSVTKTALKGNVLIGTTTDSGYKLLVSGSTFISDDSYINGIRIGRGSGAIISNTAIGNTVLNANTSGTNIVAIGLSALGLNTTGSNNIGIGVNALVGNNIGSNNLGIGFAAGRYLSDGITNNSSGVNNIYIGLITNSFSAASTNEIVIGNNNTGFGSNSVVLGNTGITKTILRGNVLIGTTADTVTDKLQVAGSISLIGSASTTIFKAAWGTSNFSISDSTPSNVVLYGVSAPSASNYFLRVSSSSTIINSPITTGTIFIRQGNVDKAQFMPTTGNLILQNGGTYTDNNIDRLQVSGSVISTGYKTISGTSTQYLMADGSVSLGPSLTDVTITGTSFTIDTNNTRYICTSSASTIATVASGITGNIEVLRYGIGGVSFTGGTGTTLRYSSFVTPSISEQYATAALTKLVSAGEIRIYGELASI